MVSFHWVFENVRSTCIARYKTSSIHALTVSIVYTLYIVYSLFPVIDSIPSVLHITQVCSGLESISPKFSTSGWSATLLKPGCYQGNGV